jgi:hypothetical protein
MGWGGVGGKNTRKIVWVSWGKVCKLKSDGELGVRDFRGSESSGAW